MYCKVITILVFSHSLIVRLLSYYFWPWLNANTWLSHNRISLCLIIRIGHFDICNIWKVIDSQHYKIYSDKTANTNPKMFWIPYIFKNQFVIIRNALWYMYSKPPLYGWNIAISVKHYPINQSIIDQSINQCIAMMN